MIPYDCEQSQSPETPLQNTASNYEFSRADSCSNRNNAPPDHQNEVIPMLQQQQLILQRVLESQKVLEDRQNIIEDKLAGLKAQLDKPPVSSSSSSDGKRKWLVSRALSVSLSAYTHEHA